MANLDEIPGNKNSDKIFWFFGKRITTETFCIFELFSESNELLCVLYIASYNKIVFGYHQEKSHTKNCKNSDISQMNSNP